MRRLTQNSKVSAKVMLIQIDTKKQANQFLRVDFKLLLSTVSVKRGSRLVKRRHHSSSKKDQK